MFQTFCIQNQGDLGALCLADLTIFWGEGSDEDGMQGAWYETQQLEEDAIFATQAASF